MIPSDRFFDDTRGDLLLQSTNHQFARVRSADLRRDIRSAEGWLPDDLETLPDLMPEGIPMLAMQEDAASLRLLLTHVLAADPSEEATSFEPARRCTLSLLCLLICLLTDSLPDPRAE